MPKSVKAGVKHAVGKLTDEQGYDAIANDVPYSIAMPSIDTM